MPFCLGWQAARVGHTGAMERRRITRYGLGFNATFASLAIGLCLLAVGLLDGELPWWGRALAIAAGIAFLVVAWFNATTPDPRPEPEGSDARNR